MNISTISFPVATSTVREMQKGEIARITDGFYADYTVMCLHNIEPIYSYVLIAPDQKQFFNWASKRPNSWRYRPQHNVEKLANPSRLTFEVEQFHDRT